MGSKKNIILLSLFCFFFLEISAQVGIGTTNPDASSVLDVESTSAGVLIPRVALNSINDVTTIVSPATSLLVYNTNTINDVTPGFYFWNGGEWSRINDKLNENSNKAYGEIYKTFGTQSINSNNPVRFGTRGVYKGVIPYPATAPISHDIYQAFEIITPGIYRVSYSISIVKTGGSVVTFGFHLRVGTGPTLAETTEVPSSYTHEQAQFVDPGYGNANCSMTKIIHLDAGDRIYVFPTISYTHILIREYAATMNIELIEAD